MHEKSSPYGAITTTRNGHTARWLIARQLRSPAATWRPRRASPRSTRIRQAADRVILVGDGDAGLGSINDGSGSVDQQRSQIGVAALANAQKPALAAAGVLPWNQSQPGGELPPVLKCVSVADGCNNRGRNQWPYPLDGGNPLAVRCGLECDLNPVIGGVLFVQLGQLLIESPE